MTVSKMIRKYIIDGNNLIGKIADLKKMDKKSVREALAFKLERYFHNKKIEVLLHFDGFENEVINRSGIKIIYSNNKTADDNIRDEISNSKNPKLLTLVSSDHALQDYARKNSCSVITSENFNRDMNKLPNVDKEDSLIKGIDNDEMMKLFGIE